MAGEETNRVSGVLGGVLLIAVAVVIVVLVYLVASQHVDSGVGGGPMPIHEAALAGNVNEINRLIQSGARIDVPIESGLAAREGMTPLICAAAEGNAETVRALLSAGARVHARAKDGRTALIHAAWRGDVERVQLLIDAGARVDARSSGGWTALMMASARGDAASVRALVEAGATVDAANKWRQTPLMAAARSGHVEHMRILLENGANAGAIDTSGASVLAIASTSEEATDEVLSLLIAAGGNPNIADHDGMTPLMQVAQRGRADLVAFLLANGADADAIDGRERTARDWAELRQDQQGAAVLELLDAR